MIHQSKHSQIVLHKDLKKKTLLNTLKVMKTIHRLGEYICKSHTSKKGLVSRQHKELSNHNNKTNKQLN